MFKHNKFGFYAFTLCLAGLAYTFVGAALQSQVPELPTVVGSFLAVPAAALCCRRMAANGARQGLILSAALAALAALNGAGRTVVPEGGAYVLFVLSAAVARCAGILICICLAALCAGWSIRCRGRMLSLVLLGGPLFCAAGPAITAGLEKLLPGCGSRIISVSAAGALFLLALAARFLMRDTPEEAGFYPDGAGYAPDDGPEEPPLPLRQLLSDRRTWRLILVFGPLAAVAAGSPLCAIAFRSAPAGGMDRWLAMGAGMSLLPGLVFGLLADLAEPAALVLLACAGLLPPAALLLAPADGALGTVGTLLLGAGMACLAGGIPVLISWALGRLYGRRQFAAAGAVVFPAVLLCAAGAPIVTGWLIRSGLGRTACTALAGLAAVALAASLLLFSAKDADAPDRGQTHSEQA